MSTSNQPAAADHQAGRGFTEHRLAADGFTTRYWDAGSGEPLLCLHGAGGRLPNLALDLLSADFRVIQLEFPGFGDEENFATESAEQMGATVLEFADALGLDGFALLGTSMGGVVAAWTALQAQDRVTRLVLEAPGAFRPDTSPADLSPEELFNAFHAHPERKVIVPEDPARMQRNWPLISRLMGPLHDAELERRLASLRVPALVLYGSRDGLFGTDPGRVYRRAIPQCTFSIVYDAAHDVAGDRPEAFAALVGDFLNRGPEFAISDKSTMIYR